jgi:hypothetical protein
MKYPNETGAPDIIFGDGDQIATTVRALQAIES